jgi:hypothetical protein
MDETVPRTLTIGDVTFDRVEYTAFVDEFNCWIGPTRKIVGIDETPEDHFLRFDAAGELYQFFIYPARTLLRRDGEIRVTLPGRPTVVLTREQLEPLFVDPDEGSNARANRRWLRRQRWMRRLGFTRLERLLQRAREAQRPRRGDAPSGGRA